MTERLETASCFCGAVKAEMHGEPFWICYDHDDDCRRAIGSPLNVWVGYRPAQFRLTRGTPKSFSKTKGVFRTFCADYGTSISYWDEGRGDELYVTIGFFDHPEKIQAARTRLLANEVAVGGGHGSFAPHPNLFENTRFQIWKSG